MVVYNPDPFYNLYEQISWLYGQTLADQGMHVRVAIVKAAWGEQMAKQMKTP